MIKPTKGYILAELLTGEKELPSGLVLIDNLKEIARIARVVTCGDPFTNRKGKVFPTCCKPGDIIHFHKSCAEKLVFSNMKCVFIKNGDIFAKEV